jgi:subtilisin family serine protease
MIGVSPGSKLRVYKVLGDDGSGRVDWIAKAIRDAADDGCDVISMSLGGPSADQWIPPALDYARSKGVIVIAAAGNEGPNANTVGFPGGYKQCLAVAAHDSADRVASFSSRGPAVFTSGPGVDVRAAYPGPGDGRFATMSGTSMATPYIAGVAALWASANKNLKKDASRHDLFAQQLRAVCTRPEQRTTASGYGKPNVAKLLPELEEPNPPDNPTNPPVTPITVTISEASLTPEELKKLKAAGIERFSFTINPAVIPKVTAKQNRMELKLIPGIGWTLVPVE